MLSAWKAVMYEGIPADETSAFTAVAIMPLKMMLEELY